jgi:cytochrome c peroxidase
MDNIGRAIAAFERTVITGPSRFDQYMDGDKSVLTDSEKRGLILFTTTASCTACHSGPNFTDNKFHALGVRQAGPLAEDLGRFAVTKDPNDKYGFKTPGLRNIEQSAPYMHDGSLCSLEEVVDFYNRGGERGDIRSRLIQPLNMSDSQKTDLVAFLRSLTGPLPEITAPEGDVFGK